MTLRCKVAWAAVLIGVLPMTARPAAQTPVSAPIRMLGDAAYPPLAYLDRGAARGLSVDVAFAVGKVLGRDVQVRLMDWAEAQSQVLAGLADAVVDLSMSDQRRQQWDFSEPIFTHEFGLFVRAGEAGIFGLDDLTGRAIGVVPGSFPADFLKGRADLTIVPVPSYDEGVDALASGAIAALAADIWVGGYTIHRRGLRGIAMAGDPFATRLAGIAVKKGQTALLNEINRAIRQLRADGTLAAINARWAPQEILFLTRERVQRQVVLYVAAGGGVLLAGLAVWIVTLRRQIRVRKAAERDLAESRAGLDLALSSAEMGTWRWSAATGETAGDAGLTALWGLGSDRTIANADSWLARLHPDDQAGVRDAFERTTRDGAAFAREFRIVAPDGGVRWLRAAGKPHYAPSGELTDVTGVTFDVTDQRAAEEALRVSEERFAKAFQTSPSCVAISDMERGILEINDRFEELTGYPRAEVIGRTIVEAGLMVDPSQRDEFLREMRRTGSVRGFEFKVRRKDGAVRLAQVSAQMLAIAGRPCFLSVTNDITDARRLETSLQQASEINRLLVSKLEPEPLFRAITESVGKAIRVDYLGVMLNAGGATPLEPGTEVLFVDGRAVPLEGSKAIGAPLADLALARGGVSVFERADLAGIPAAARIIAEGLHSVCCSPLQGRTGPLGLLALGSRRDRAFGADELAVVHELSTYVAIAIQNARTYDELNALKNQLTREKLYLEEEIRVDHDFREIIGTSPALRRVLAQIETVAPTDATVLLLGETGTGKELLARALHDRSLRRDRTFVRVNAAALPAALIESELFGYERGAFTGAAGARVGRFELADRGSLFLDEVGDIPLELQPKLLRVLQEGEFERLGSNRSQRVDVRLIAATNRDLTAMAGDGSFRRDLYYRLNVFPIHVPPLRARPGDIPLLVRHFVQRFSQRLKRPIETIPTETMAALQRWHWPGNIRELQNVIERAVILSPGPDLQVTLGDGAAPAPAASQSSMPASPPPATPARLDPIGDAEREAILRALRESNGVVAGADGAAARLGLKRTTLQSKMRKLGINRPSY